MLISLSERRFDSGRLFTVVSPSEPRVRYDGSRAVRAALSSQQKPQPELSSAYTSRVLVHGLDSKSRAAGFKSLAVCFARVFARAAVWQQSRWVMPSP
jgi:hypothetical protein